MPASRRVLFTVIALVGAVAWSVVALVRGEQINAVWFVFAAVCTYVIAYRFYARLVEAKIVRPRNDRATPAELHDNAKDFMPTDRRVLFGHHFAAIAGAGPLVGPVLAAQMGYLPGTIWIIVGCVLGGAVQDYLVLSISTRRRGRSLGQMARDELGRFGGVAALIAVFVIMIIIIAVLALVVVNALAESPWGVFSIAMTIPIALFMGVYLRFLRPGRVSEVTVIGVALLLLAIVAGGWVAETDVGAGLVHAEPGRARLVAGRVRLRGVGAAGVAAARPAGLPVDLHEGRRDHPARRRHRDRAAGGAGARRVVVRARAATARCSPARCSRSCSSPSRAVRCPGSTRSSRRGPPRSCWRRRARRGPSGTAPCSPSRSSPSWR